MIDIAGYVYSQVNTGTWSLKQNGFVNK